MKRLILKWLPIVARLVPRNRDKDYPQLWYCMPHRRKRKLLGPRKALCAGCGIRIKGVPARGEGTPSGAHYWCSKCHPDEIGPEGRPVARQYPVGYKLGDIQPALIGFWLTPMIEWTCGRLTGHELSRTEWGYGGGMFVDRWCRWCGKLIKVPKSEERTPKALQDSLGIGDEPALPDVFGES